MKRRISIALGILGLVTLGGCSQAGMFIAGNLTTVELSAPNYRVVAVGVSGEAKAGYLLGVSFSNGPQAGSLALARVAGTGQLYKEALANLWLDFEKTHGPVAGRRLALANIRYDADSRNLLFYTDTKLCVRADVIEFTD
ncbi:MAG: hypothetical protein IT369_15835 [Candidatus Latescibacteria bacterium]|nr:hypothetical protein [Candidatus Latescibacterota bacterium]